MNLKQIMYLKNLRDLHDHYKYKLPIRWAAGEEAQRYLWTNPYNTDCSIMRIMGWAHRFGWKIGELQTNCGEVYLEDPTGTNYFVVYTGDPPDIEAE